MTSGAGNPLRLLIPARESRVGRVIVFHRRARILSTGICGSERISAVRLGNVVDSVAGFMGVSGLVSVVVNTYILYLVRGLYSLNNQLFIVFLLCFYCEY